jgi:outer membrane protein assembly factor BamB
MPTPIIYGDQLYVLGNAGVFDSYNYRTGDEVYRSRLLHKGSGFSASPVISDGRLYASSEDGDIFVVKTGPAFEVLAQNAMGEPLMATPAIAGRTMFVRGQRTLFAIAKTKD